MTHPALDLGIRHVEELTMLLTVSNINHDVVGPEFDSLSSCDSPGASINLNWFARAHLSRIALCIALCRGKECSKIGTQAILNLALSAVRLRLETEAHPHVDDDAGLYRLLLAN